MGRLMDRIFGPEGEISDGAVKDLYDNVETDIEYSPERAVKVARKASEYTNFDEQGAVSLNSNFLMMDGSSERALRETFGDMLFGDDRKNRETRKMIGSGDVSYEEIGAATIGAGLAAAKVDDVNHTPYSPAYGELFENVVEGRWNMNPDVVGDFQENIDHYQEIVQETAETVEEQMLELRPEPGIDKIDRELEDWREQQETETEKEKELE
ncbi:MAG: hypothetical protein ABEJ36_00165 [Candidatus Nanosalina sp.]